ncbi:MAG: ABC transporter ATP-binding protein [Synergistaceae bacterium]|jgi:oligopeptide/dipeptide ABC transporter ATP-binding protein|nr:ABC transporter ATP-binding protein [Synergistaceae bacterium]
MGDNDFREARAKNAEKLLDVRNLEIQFKTKNGYISAVEGLNFSVHRSELLAMVGESGCGKSVTSLAVMGLIEHPGRVRADRMELAGVDMTRSSPEEIRRLRGAQMSMIFQDPLTSLNPLFTAGHQISEQFLTHVPGCGRGEAKRRSIEMIRKTGIPRPEAVYDSYPHELSGGMRQRIMIAIAMCCNPVLLIADEPTTALDVTIQAQILHLMRELVVEYETSILFITHDLGVVAEMADRVVVMYAGQIVEEADVLTLFHKPAHPYTKGLLHSTIKVQDAGSRLEPIPGAVPSLRQLPSGCRFHPRCAYADDECRRRRPELVEVGLNHYSRCLLFPRRENVA